MHAPCIRLTANVMDGETVLFAADVTPTDSVGDWMVSFTPTISGTYQLVLAFEGNRALTGTPHRVRVKTDETVAGNCKLYGAGLTRAVAGERTSFSIKGESQPANAEPLGLPEYVRSVLDKLDPSPGLPCPGRAGSGCLLSQVSACKVADC